MNAVFNHPFTEVDHKSQFKRGLPKICQNLGFKNGVIGRCSFTLDNDFSVYCQVDPKMGRKGSSFVEDWKVHLSLDNKIALFKLPSQGFFINAFKQPRPAKVTVNLNRGIKNVTTDPVLCP